MLFGVVSDTHLEYDQYVNLPGTYDCLLLCGDIANSNYPFLETFLTQCKFRSKIVVYIAGNHEYWYSDIESTNKHLKELCDRLGIIYLQNNHMCIGDIGIYGGTMWANPMDWVYTKKYKGDSVRIRRYYPTVYREYHNFRANLEKFRYTNYRKRIVMSHHCPSWDTCEERGELSTLYHDYVSLDNIDYWCYGHTHKRRVDQIEDTTLITWAHGRPREISEPYQPYTFHL